MNFFINDNNKFLNEIFIILVFYNHSLNFSSSSSKYLIYLNIRKMKLLRIKLNKKLKKNLEI